jgi:hypothetical protein
MGFRVLQIAVSGKTVEQIHQDYSVEPTNQYEDIPESSVSGAYLPNGCYLIYVNDHIEPEPTSLAKLSANASLVSCYVNETVMNSSASSWIDGVETWSVVHDAQQGLDHLAVNGTPPAQFSEIKTRMSEKQSGAKDVDYTFDVPVELFEVEGGLRYDKDIPGAGPNAWQVLNRIRTGTKLAKKRWWSWK